MSGQPQKFAFDTVFDGAGAIAQPSRLPKRLFPADEVEQIRAAAYAEGERAAKIMREDMETMGPVRLRDVDQAQVAMVQVAKDLAAKGEIMLAGQGGDDELIY